MPNRKMKKEDSVLAEADNDCLHRLLLIEQIKAARRDYGRGWLWHTVPIFGSILASLAAAIIIILFGTQYVKETISYYQSRTEKLRHEIATLKQQIDKLNVSRDNTITNLKALQNEKQQRLLAISAIADADQSIHLDEAIGIFVEIQNDEGIFFLMVDTYPQNAKVIAFEEIGHNFVFPGQSPDPGKSTLFYEVKGLSSDSKRDVKSDESYSPCRVGPIVVFKNSYVWIMAEYNGKQSFKCVHLTNNNIR